MRSSTVFWISVALVAGSTGASAQRMYRCGSAYQDRPCESGVADKVFRSGGAEVAGANALKSVADPDCIQRGARAQQIVWSRESGKTAEEMGQQAPNEQQRRLVAEVYALRGSAPQVRDAIQAKCQQDKDQAVQAAALVAAVMRGQAASSPAPDAKPQALESTRDPNPVKSPPTAGYSACDDFKTRLESFRNQQRQGGSAQVMESLRQRHASLEKAARAQDCK